ncbi:MAG: site-specific DNA-methyltransferase, partial [Arcobacteraceae bacterium]
MTKNEKRFWDILSNLFIGAEVKGKSGFISLMKAKQSYFKKVEKDLHQYINEKTKDNNTFKEELYDKLYSFFHRYFSESGSIYYTYTPLFYKIYTKAYSNNILENQTYSTDYEQIISNKEDTSLFYKTQMLYYVKSDKIFKDLEIEIDGYKYIFDVSNMEGKKANEKKSLVYKLENIEKKNLSFSVTYSERGKKTKMNEILKAIKNEKLSLKEHDFSKAIKVFEKQSNIDYFINKDAKKFLTEQLDMWIYQYMFSQESDFDIQRFEQIKTIKGIALKLINFISQFENELVKIWNKPRFVTNSNIVVTLDKLESKGYTIDKLENHKGYKSQKEEWEELGISKKDNLFDNKFLPFDTKFFPDLKDEIESLFDEDEFNGLLIKSENYQALNTILPRFRGKVDVIYIDPPYNTKDDEFIYQDNYKNSTWLSMMSDRLKLSNNFLTKKGNFFCSIDDNQMAQLKILNDEIFGKNNFMGNIAWESKTKSQNTKDSYNKLHPKIEYILSYSNNKKPRFNLEVIGKKDYPLIDENGDPYRIQRAEQDSLSRPHAAQSMVYPILGIFPKEGKCWKFGISKKDDWEKENRIVLQDNYPCIIFRPEDEIQDKTKPFWGFFSKDEGTAETGKKELSNMLTHTLDTIKPVSVIKKLIFHSSNKEDIIMDYFSGSGTTAESVIRLNKEDNGSRKFILVE